MKLALPFLVRHQSTCSCGQTRRTLQYAVIALFKPPFLWGKAHSCSLPKGSDKWGLHLSSLALRTTSSPDQKSSHGESLSPLQDGAKGGHALAYPVETTSVQAILTYLLGNLQDKRQEQVTWELSRRLADTAHREEVGAKMEVW